MPAILPDDSSPTAQKKMNLIIKEAVITITVMLPTLLQIIDSSVVNVSLQHIIGSLSGGIDESTWIITSYLVASGIVIPITGWLCRVFGRKNYLLFSIILFITGSFFCGFAQNLQTLIFFRVLQGIGGGGLAPISQAILLETYPHEQRGMAMAFFGMGMLVGPIIGPVLGGWITENGTWRWIFYINVPIGIISVILTALFIEDPPYLKRHLKKINYSGLFLLIAWVGCLQTLLDKGQKEGWFTSNYMILLACVSAVAFLFFIATEAFSDNPVMNLKTFRNITFTSGSIVLFCITFVLYNTLVLLPIYLQTLMGYTSLKAGLTLAPGGLATLITLPLVGKLIGRVNPKGLLIFGMLLTAYATYLATRFTLLSDYQTIVLPRIILGMGMAFVFTPLTVLAFATIPKADMGNATSIYNLLRNLGGEFRSCLRNDHPFKQNPVSPISPCGAYYAF